MLLRFVLNMLAITSDVAFAFHTDISLPVKPSFFAPVAIESAPGPAAGWEAHSIVADNQRRPSQSGAGRAVPSSSEESTFRESAQGVLESTSETRWQKCNHLCSRNRAAYAWHHSGQREDGEISPFAEEGRRMDTPTVDVHLGSSSAAPALSPVPAEGNQSPTYLKQRWLSRTASTTRFEDQEVTLTGSPHYVGSPNLIQISPPRHTVHGGNATSRKRTRQAGGQLWRAKQNSLLVFPLTPPDC